MIAPIDSGRVYRFPSELVELVEAVLRTGPNNESTWIEWKSTLDLAERTAVCHIAKHVLGFANRLVATAMLHAEGYAYLIVGAEPDNLVGVTPVDPANLRPQVQRYVGPAVSWRGEYVTVDGKHVLVVIVDPPQPGDGIHPVRNQLDVHPKGRVLVRHPGSTDPADDFEIDQLVGRVRDGEDGLDLVIDTIIPVIEQQPEWPDADEVVAVERKAILARPRIDDKPDPFGLGGAVNAGFGLGRTADNRDEDDYRREIDAYCDEYLEATFKLRVWRMWRHWPLSLQLAVVNRTDSNFNDVELEVHIPGDVATWPRDFEDVSYGNKPVLPTRPNVLGTPRPLFPGMAEGYYVPQSITNLASPDPYRGPSYEARDSGSVTVVFSDIDLRPRQRAELPRVRLLIDAAEGTTLDCTWKSTARNARGLIAGGFALTVVSSTVNVESVDVPKEPNVNDVE
ncbi:MAG: ATP-binding protein [Actinophytocola sp.]|uniref:AlbA family DNA-binding domain-containing protein n=1 Tax=Actinophytocola sp. TaxID=1872138 RepID=UPI003C76D1EC